MSNAYAGFVRTLMKRAERFEEGDYVGEGELVYCAKCRTPKESWIDTEAVRKLFGGPAKFPIACECQRAQRREEEEAAARAAAKREEEQRRARAFALESWRACTFAADDGKAPVIRKTLEKYANRSAEMLEQGIGIALTGEAGSGKTFFAAALTNALLNRGHSVRMTSISRVQKELEADYGEDTENVLRRLRTVDFLVLDDLGSERDTSYGQEIVYKVVNERYVGGKPLIVTTNLSRADLEAPHDLAASRVYGRIVEMCPVLLALQGNRRGDIARAKRDLARELMQGG